MADVRITPATGAPPTLSATRLPELASKTQGFGETLVRALADVNDHQLKAQEASIALAAGEDRDMAQTLVTIEKANISFQFAMQIRNKLLEAYQEIMRLSV